MFLLGPGTAILDFLIFAVSAVLVAIVMSRVVRVLTGSRHSLGCRRPHHGRTVGLSGGSWVCDKSDCRAENPQHARYCKRCGRQRVPTDFGE